MRSFSSMSATHSTKSPIPSKERKCHRLPPWLIAFRHPLSARRLGCAASLPPALRALPAHVSPIPSLQLFNVPRPSPKRRRGCVRRHEALQFPEMLRRQSRRPVQRTMTRRESGPPVFVGAIGSRRVVRRDERIGLIAVARTGSHLKCEPRRGPSPHPCRSR